MPCSERPWRFGATQCRVMCRVDATDIAISPASGAGLCASARGNTHPPLGRAEPTLDDVRVLVQRGSNLPNGVTFRTKALALFACARTLRFCWRCRQLGEQYLAW